MYKILPYYGYGNNEKVVFRGRVVIDNGYEKYKERDGFINDVIGFWKRFSVRPATDIQVSVQFENKSIAVKTNEYGIFSTTFDPVDIENDKWLVAQATIDLQDENTVVANLTSINDVSGNEFGIISDVDDTILISKATRKLQLIYLTIFKKPSERLAFDNVAEFYNELVKGRKQNNTNPIFYVSSSHWNLFDLLTDFLELNKFPKGALLLKRVKGIRDTITSVGNHDHKKTKIIEVIKTYPDLPFILIGDSGQHDAAIYSMIARDYPEHIKAIFIRDVTNYDDPLVTNAKSVIPDNIPFRVFKTTTQAIEQARELNLL